MKKYKVSSIALATGLTQSTITSFACNRGWTTKGGLDLSQILAVLKGKRRDKGGQPDAEEVEELREILTTIGAIESSEDE